MNYFLVKDGKQSGPYSSEQMKEMIGRGEVLADNLVLFEGIKEWIPVSSVFEFQGLFKVSPAIRTAAQISAERSESIAHSINTNVPQASSPPSLEEFPIWNASPQTKPHGCMLWGGWVWFVIFALAAIGIFGDGEFIVGCICLFSGLIFCPPLVSKFPFKLWQRIVGVIVCIMLIGLLGKDAGEDSGKGGSNQASTNSQAPATTYQLGADTFPFTLQEFVDEWHQLNSSDDGTVYLPIRNIQKLSEDAGQATYVSHFNDALLITWYVDKLEQKVSSICISYNPENERQFDNFRLSLGFLLKVTNPQATGKEILGVLNTIFENMQNAPNSRLRGVVYGLKFNDGVANFQCMPDR